jgi:hypothetical protein
MLHAFNARLGSLLDECRTNECYIGAGDPQIIISEAINAHISETISKFENKYGIQLSTLMPNPNQDTIREFLQDTKRFAAWILKYCEEKMDQPRHKYFESFRYRLNLKNFILEPRPKNAHPEKTMQLEYEAFSDKEATTTMVRLNGKYRFIRKGTISQTADEYAYFFENLLTDNNMILDFTIDHETEYERRKSYEYLIKAWSLSFFPALIDYLYVVDGVEPGDSVKMYMLDSFNNALKTLCREVDELDTVIEAAYKITL